jgi:hypothetical protein
VLDGLGRQVIESGAWTFMNTLDFALAGSINKKLITIDDKATTA